MYKLTTANELHLVTGNGTKRMEQDSPPSAAYIVSLLFNCWALLPSFPPHKRRGRHTKARHTKLRAGQLAGLSRHDIICVLKKHL